MAFDFRQTAIADVLLIEAQSFADERGYFMESYRESHFAAAGIRASFVQDNLSYSKHGVLRGLHFQRRPFAQGKLVQVLRGEIFDVAVDLRPGSETFGKWIGELLSHDNRRLLWVPEGFAHGFQVTGDEALVHYKCTSEYAPQADGGVRWDDPDLGVEWPLLRPRLSAKDEALPLFEQVREELVTQGEG